EIDPNNNKFNEDRVIQSEFRLEDSVHRAKREKGRNRKNVNDKKIKNQKLNKVLSFPMRFLFALLACICFFFALCFFSPLQLISAASVEFSFNITHVWWQNLIFSSLLSIICAFIISLFKGRAFCVVTTFVFSLGLCCFIQRLLLNYAMPIAMGENLDLNFYKKTTILSACVWILIIAICQVIVAKRPLFIKYFIGLLSAFLIITQSVMLIIAIPASLENVENYTVSSKGLYEVSQKNDVELICLDQFDQVFFNGIINLCPDILDEFTDFTAYTNTSAYFEFTRYGSPFLITSNVPLGWSDEEYMNNSTKFYDEITKAGYSVGVYSRDTYNLKEKISPYTINVSQTQIAVNNFEAIKQMLKCGCYRDLPWIFKPYFSIYAETINGKVVASVSADGVEQFTSDDSEIYHNLKDQNLQFAEYAPNGSFKFYHLAGTHAPLEYLDYFIKDPDNANHYTQGAAELRLVSEYLKNLKRLGIYDDATIIVSTDHGAQQGDKPRLANPDTPMILYKPAKKNNPNPLGQAIKFCDYATGHMDLHKTIIDVIGGDTSKFSYDNAQIFHQLQPNNRDRYFYKSYNPQLDWNSTHDVDWIEYVCKDGNDANKLENWIETGVRYPVISEYTIRKNQE
ncbi:MAG: hypothetical protein MJ189_01355, partial [Coriobacteriales bacterium]|nr:hypothetical protein [Coriobacteriales bacterium]